MTVLDLYSENVVLSPNYCSRYQEIGIAESNGDVRIDTGSSYSFTVSAHAEYKFAQNSPKRLARRRAAF